MGFASNKATSILSTYIKSGHYVGLFTEEPVENLETGVVTFEEIAIGDTTGYQRAALGTVDTASKPAQVANSSIIYFPETKTNWGSITHFGLFESQSATSPYFWGELTTPVTISDVDYDNGNTYVPIFRAHALIIGLDLAEIDTNY